ncbi:uncharacterized protein Nmnat [Fopius arisanus]|uniref:Nicotinamide/nicotinic acid mononucleotide adenylyltransferase 3 n=2 Tax=Fopius arisanus TaxID=64838 RepID=A0A9R1U524_9HYME|nr:PREDICTED: uncharacterized protein LOC105269051 [Fopius arisanus]
MAPTRVILMSCGSYNPPTHLHLRMFEIARDHLHRMGTHEVVGGVISLVHDNYGKKELAGSEHRCAMVKLAIQSSEWIKLSTWEIRQNSWTKTRHSLQYHQNLLNAILLDSPDIKSQVAIEDLEWIPENVRNGTDRSPIQIKLLCGADLLESFGKPGLWAEEDIDAILGHHGLVVITREGSSPNKFIYDSDILSTHMHNIYIVTEWIPNEVSSSRIRRALKRGESIRYLTQDSVIDYIYQHGIYDAKLTSTTTKFELSPTTPNNYLHIDNKYETVLLTPSPSDVTMTTPSPVEIITIDIGETVIKKNLHNSPYYTTNDRMYHKLPSVVQENGNKNSSIGGKSTYPGQAKQIITTETGETHIFYEVGSLNDNDSTNVQNHDEIDLAITVNDVNNISEKKPEECPQDNCENRETCYQIDASVSFDSIDDPIPSEPSQKSEESKNESNTIIEEPTLVNSSISESKLKDLPPDPEEVVSVPEVTSSQETRDGNSVSQIDGKYLKSVVNSRKSPNRVRNSEQVVPMMESELEKSIENDRTNYQGSLDSINQRKSETERKSELERSRTKSKSFELLKSDFSLKQVPFKDEDLNDTGSQESAAFVTANEEQEPEEFCSVCYNREQSIRNVYPLRSTNSSPNVQDSPECDICSSYNLQEIGAPPGMPQCELCEICGDIAMEEDVVASSRPETEESLDLRLLSSSSHLPLSLSRRKLRSGRVPLDGRIFDITDDDPNCQDINEEDEDEKEVNEASERERAPSTSVEEFSGDDSTLNDVEFEIENCGLDVEPQEIIKPIIEELHEAEVDSTCRINRGSSMINRATESRGESRRRYKSVDNLPTSRVNQAKAPTKEDKALVVRHSGRIIGSADNIRAPRPSRSVSLLRKSADDVGRIHETAETEEESGRIRSHMSEKGSRIPSDTVKFILGKHGIKIISDKETAL